MFLGATCLVCARPGDRLCPACLGQLAPARAFAAPDGLDACVALLAYDGVARDLVVALKYRNARSLVSRSGAALAAQVADALRAPSPPDDSAPASGPAIDVVTWAPTGRARRRNRGYDQAELVARAVGRSLRVPSRALLVRRPGAAQTGLSRQARLAGPAFALARAAAGHGGARILVVDDVLTTGATLAAAAHALRRLEPAWVGGAVLAHTALASQVSAPIETA